MTLRKRVKNPLARMTEPEALMWVQIQELRTELPVPEFSFDRSRKWRFDFCFTNLMLAVEVEGGTWQPDGGRHNRGPGYEDDCEKYNAAILLGYKLFRFTTPMVEDGRAIATLRQALVNFGVLSDGDANNGQADTHAAGANKKRLKMAAGTLIRANRRESAALKMALTHVSRYKLILDTLAGELLAQFGDSHPAWAKEFRAARRLASRQLREISDGLLVTSASDALRVEALINLLQSKAESVSNPQERATLVLTGSHELREDLLRFGFLQAEANRGLEPFMVVAP